MAKVTLLVLLTLSVSYYLYTPLPAGIQEPWRLMMLDATLRTMGHVDSLIRLLGGSQSLGELLISVDESLSEGITDTTFAGVPVRVYSPPAGAEGQLRRAVLYIHGGGWAVSSTKGGPYDALCRKMASELGAVVVSVEYRLYPKVIFPEPYLDCLAVAKHLLTHEVLAQLSIDPERVAVAGDSAGGNLAAAVAQEVSLDEGVEVKLRLQALIYPALQAVDFNTPSYLDSGTVPPLSRPFMLKFWLQYLGVDVSQVAAALKNQHSGADRVPSELWARVDWTSLLQPELRRQHQRVRVQASSLDVPGLLDVRASPLLAEDRVLAATPPAYVMTAQHDVLRDDGLMYARRLRDAGVAVTADHYDDGFHGCMSMIFDPFAFEVGKRAEKRFIAWLQSNL